MNTFLVEVIQVQTFTIEVEADDKQEAIDKANNSQGVVAYAYSPELLTSKTTVLRSNEV